MWKEPRIDSRLLDHARAVSTGLVAVLAVIVLLLVGGCAAHGPVASHSALGAGSDVALPEKETSHTSSSETSRAERDSGRSAVHSGQAPASIQPWRFGEHDGRLIATENYRIYTTVRRSNFLEELPSFYEAVLDHYTSALGDLPRPPEPLVTYLFQSRSQWQAKTAEMLPQQAGIFNTLGRGGFTTGGTAVLYYIDYRRRRGSPDTFAIAAHEGWHQYTQTTFKHHLPIWLEEGVATYMEGYRVTSDGTPQFRPWTNRERRAALADALRNREVIPLAELVRRSPQSFLEAGKSRLLTYYAQVWALTRFLVEWENGFYRDALEEALQDAAEGRLVGRLSSSTAITGQRRRAVAATSRSGPWLILEYFNRDFAAFEDQYMSYLRTVAQGGR